MRGGLRLARRTLEELDVDRGLGLEERWRGLSGESDSIMSKVSSDSGVVASVPAAATAAGRKPMAVDPKGTGCGLP